MPFRDFLDPGYFLTELATATLCACSEISFLARCCSTPPASPPAPCWCCGCRLARRVPRSSGGRRPPGAAVDAAGIRLRQGSVLPIRPVPVLALHRSAQPQEPGVAWRWCDGRGTLPLRQRHLHRLRCGRRTDRRARARSAIADAPSRSARRHSVRCRRHRFCSGSTGTQDWRMPSIRCGPTRCVRERERASSRDPHSRSATSWSSIPLSPRARFRSHGVRRSAWRPDARWRSDISCTMKRRMVLPSRERGLTASPIPLLSAA